MDLLPCFCCLAPVVLALAVLAYLPLLKKEQKKGAELPLPPGDSSIPVKQD